MRYEVNLAELKRLHSEGLNDSEIARRMNVSATAVRYWRRKLNLKSNYTCKRKVDVEKLIQLREQKCSMREIAERLGVCFGTVQYWFRKLKIKPLRIRRVRKVNLEELIKLYYDGLKYREIAEKMGISKATVNIIVSKLKIANRCKKRIEEVKIEKEEIIRMINEKGYTTLKDIEARYGVGKEAAYRHINALFRKGKIHKFTVHGAYSFFGEKLRNIKTLYYTDERRLIEALSEIVNIKDASMSKSFTHILRNNGISSENIAYFHKLQKMKSGKAA